MAPSELEHKKVLYACLDWGKGHVARSIGVIRQLIDQSNEVVLAGNDEQQLIFEAYFPELRFLKLEGYRFAFSGAGRFAKDLWRSRKRVREMIRFEREWVERLCLEEHFDVVLSDHRYGFRSEKVFSVFLTHQLNLAVSAWQWPVQRWHRAVLRTFDEIWVFDQPDSRLAGKLSVNKQGFNARYIGFYSRFSAGSEGGKTGEEVVICNGPTPYDEQLFLRYAREGKRNRQIIAPQRIVEMYPGIPVVSSQDWKHCDALIQAAPKLYAYCGYTTLMDLQVLGCSAQLTPTPGQAEQVYLYRLHVSGKTNGGSSS